MAGIFPKDMDKIYRCFLQIHNAITGQRMKLKQFKKLTGVIS
jgi:hypothetical protein